MIIPCTSCRRGHHFGAFFVGEDVVYKANRQDRRCTVAAGTRGNVIRWGAIPNVGQYVVVEFKRRGMAPIEIDFAPCELESVARDLAGRVVVAA